MSTLPDKVSDVNLIIPRKKKRSPLQAIRAFCLGCEGSSANIVNCLYPACPFYSYRLGVCPKGQPHQPLKTIKDYCFKECQAGSSHYEVLICQGDTAILGPCPVFPFRLGKNPNISAATREKLKQAALRRDPLGLQIGKSSQAHTHFEAVESTEVGQVIVNPTSGEMDTKFDYINVPYSDMEVSH